MWNRWTPIESAGAKGQPLEYGEREPVIRRLQDGLVIARARLAVYAYRRVVHPDTSKLDNISAALSSMNVAFGEPEQGQSEFEDLPPPIWTTDRLGHPSLELWNSGEERLLGAYVETQNRIVDRATFYGVELRDAIVAQASNDSLTGEGSRTRGRRPAKRDAVKAAMLKFGDMNALAAMKEEAMAATFGASRDTCRKARGEVLSEMSSDNRDQEPRNSRHIPTIDN